MSVDLTANVKDVEEKKGAKRTATLYRKSLQRLFTANQRPVHSVTLKRWFSSRLEESAKAS